MIQVNLTEDLCLKLTILMVLTAYMNKNIVLFSTDINKFSSLIRWYNVWSVNINIFVLILHWDKFVALETLTFVQFGLFLKVDCSTMSTLSNIYIFYYFVFFVVVFFFLLLFFVMLYLFIWLIFFNNKHLMLGLFILKLK
jgi:hypothetical protein